MEPYINTYWMQIIRLVVVVVAEVVAENIYVYGCCHQNDRRLDTALG